VRSMRWNYVKRGPPPSRKEANKQTNRYPKMCTILRFYFHHPHTHSFRYNSGRSRFVVALCRVPSFDGDCTFFLFQCRFSPRISVKFLWKDFFFHFFVGTKVITEDDDNSRASPVLRRAMKLKKKLLKSSSFKLPFNDIERKIYIFFSIQRQQ
jgi:hypothetical protein